PDEAVYCARHPDVETYLRCGKCDTPICPRCLVQTPVGARCRDCAKVARMPTLEVTPIYYARGMLAAAVSGARVGVALEVLMCGRGGFGLFTVVLGLGVGWVVSEAVTRATNYKRGPALQFCAALGVIMAYLLQENLSPGGIHFRGGLI